MQPRNYFQYFFFPMVHTISERRKPVSASNYVKKSFQRRNPYELSCQQMYWMHRSAVRLPLWERELLLPGPYPGGHPRGQSHGRPVHRLQVLPEEIIPFAAASRCRVFSWRFRDTYVWLEAESLQPRKGKRPDLKVRSRSIHSFVTSQFYDENR